VRGEESVCHETRTTKLICFADYGIRLPADVGSRAVYAAAERLERLLAMLSSYFFGKAPRIPFPMLF